ncbi:MAG TPA: hypothetical protein PLB41_10005 [Rubrivivax sp.]|nr:hypothetical protein [Rubrivivax sp.]HPO20448.1 hypothetical protein [Rubrivivax sp.]
MRTTLTLEEAIAAALKNAAHESGKSFKQVVNETLRAGLAARKVIEPAKAYRLKPAALGGVRAGLDIDKALVLADALEDQEIARKLLQRK